MDDKQLAEDIRSSLWHIASALKGIELHLQNAEHLVAMSNSLEAFMGGWNVDSQPMGSFQEFLRAYQASSEARSGDWVSPSVASRAVGISARRLVQMYDQGKLDPDCAKQTNDSEERRRFVFNIKMLQESIGSTG
jgi:hypothetical protein